MSLTLTSSEKQTPDLKPHWKSTPAASASEEKKSFQAVGVRLYRICECFLVDDLRLAALTICPGLGAREWRGLDCCQTEQREDVGGLLDPTSYHSPHGQSVDAHGLRGVPVAG